MVADAILRMLLGFVTPSRHIHVIQRKQVVRIIRSVVARLGGSVNSTFLSACLYRSVTRGARV